MINKYIFREYDIRGVYGKDITEELAYLLGKAFGTKLRRLNKDTTLVGYDNRYSSPSLEKELVKGITECGVNVVRLGLVTTPMYYYGWDYLNIKSGIMITASHNPKDENGFKFSYNGINNAYGTSSLELYQMIINKDCFIRIFGNNGYIYIKDENGNIVNTIDNSTEADINGNINIDYDGTRRNLSIKTSRPIVEGEFTIKNIML